MGYAINFVIAVILTLLGCIIVQKNNKKTNRRIRLEARNNAFNHHNKSNLKDTIVFLGDSITEEFQVTEYFLNHNAINRGVSGNFTFEVLHRLDDIISLKPSTIVLCIGTNDLSIKTNTVEQTITNVVSIINRLKRGINDTNIIVLPLFPINKSKAKKIKTKYRKIAYFYQNRILKFNRILIEEMKLRDIKVLNIYNDLIDHYGDMKLEYTTDGVHLTHEAYDVVYKALINVIIFEPLLKNR